MKLPKKVKGLIWMSVIITILIFTLLFVLITSYTGVSLTKLTTSQQEVNYDK